MASSPKLKAATSIPTLNVTLLALLMEKKFREMIEGLGEGTFIVFIWQRSYEYDHGKDETIESIY